MKEVTYEDWQKNPILRMMWIWDDNIDNKIKRKFIYMLEDVTHPVVSLDVLEQGTILRKHCAEIEELKTRRMTNKELAWWLRDNNRREYKYDNIAGSASCIYYEFLYLERDACVPIKKDILIRENGGEWHEPLVEVEE